MGKIAKNAETASLGPFWPVFRFTPGQKFSANAHSFPSRGKKSGRFDFPSDGLDDIVKEENVTIVNFGIWIF